MREREKRERERKKERDDNECLKIRTIYCLEINFPFEPLGALKQNSEIMKEVILWFRSMINKKIKN